ncbi:MAG: hypothetical protein A2172_03615 [Candidatus Woykebacteria bacterium RBG_13_40_15]|uniref:AI-2E family transporter n=1 Tax=Candidatus Woykebacteria bacterium RBG_13_40_15 TaxID=1802593 RepID=A0A1G1W5V3_9BACT|nr:MAG: hypothetical protein A2172_03615 [Candidatus Woykebacteria bacterium RBG_13_40_15]
MKQSFTIEISPKSVLIAIVTILLFVVAWKIRSVLMGLFVAYILMSGFAPLVDFLIKKGINRSVAVAITYILAIGFVALLLFSIIPPLIGQIKEFVLKTPLYYDSAINIFQNSNLPVVTSENIANIISSRIDGALSNVLSVAMNVFSVFISFITVAVFTFYLLLERRRLKEEIYIIFPNVEKKRITDLMEKIEKKLGSWLRGELALMFIVGSATYIGLFILGVPYALPLAIIAGLFEIVPIIGPVLSSLPAIMVAFVHSPILAIAVVALYILVQQLENNFIVPRVMANAVGLSPIIIIISLLIGGSLFGLPGALLAVPAAGIIQVIFEDHLEHLRKES